mmetsp:Transcript_19530/g.32571  ORF Transcript_19530/g.32571 Transcript_19530/m.32571 type:complete len:94 (+) Transcript_19530:458-739(+)
MNQFWQAQGVVPLQQCPLLPLQPQPHRLLLLYRIVQIWESFSNVPSAMTYSTSVSHAYHVCITFVGPVIPTGENGRTHALFVKQRLQRCRKIM